MSDEIDDSNWVVRDCTPEEIDDARQYKPTIEEYRDELLWGIGRPKHEKDQPEFQANQDYLLDKILEIKNKPEEP